MDDGVLGQAPIGVPPISVLSWQAPPVVRGKDRRLRELLDEVAREQTRLQQILGSLRAVVWEIALPGGRLTYVNSQVIELLGRPVADWLSDPKLWADVVHPEDRGRVAAARAHGAQNEPAYDVCYRAVAVDGRVRWLRDRVQVDRDEEGRAVALRGVTIDETDQRVADLRRDAVRDVTAVLAESRGIEAAAPRLLADLATGLGWDAAALWLSDDVGRLRAVDIWASDELRGSRLCELTATTTFGLGEGLPGAVVSGGAMVSAENVTPKLMARRHAVAEAGLTSWYGFPVLGTDRVLGAVEVFAAEPHAVDADALELFVTLGSQIGQFVERVQAEQALAFQAALLRTQAESGIDGLLVVGPDGLMISFNRRFAEMWGMPPEVITSRSDDFALDEAKTRVADPVAFIERVRYLYAHPDEVSHEELLMKDGRVFDRYGAALVDDGVYLGWAWYFHDITEQKATESALRAERERLFHLATTLQASLLPPSLPQIPRLEIAACYRPAGAGVEVGGDFYDVFELGDQRWGVVIGDVCGKGAEAAALTALVRHTTRAAAMRGDDPGAVLDRVNEAVLRGSTTERFASVAFLLVDLTGTHVRGSMASGGHPLPLLLRPGRGVEMIGSTGAVMGVLDTAEAPVTHHDLLPGESVVLYTDGVTEARSAAGALYGDERLELLVAECEGLTAQALVERIEREVVGFQSGVLADDLAVVVLRVRPRA